MKVRPYGSKGMHLERYCLAAYYWATLPYRQWMNWRTSRQGRAPISVVFYHRVADVVPNAWTISRDQFAAQMDWLRHHAEVISLTEARERLVRRRNNRPAVCLTFDDGYAENCEFAIPYLLKAGLPCTYFVTSHNTSAQVPFPHDVAAGFPLQPNTRQQIQDMSREGVEIGAHTRTHCDLGTVTHPARIYDEIVGSGEDLADWISRPVRYFAFPYGMPQNISLAALRVAREAGYQSVCSAYGGYNFPGQDPFQILRFHGDPDMWRFKNWIRIDQRKVRMHQPLDFPSDQPLSPALKVE